MARKWIARLVLLTGAAAALAVVGCSLIGLGIGALADKNSAQVMRGWEIASVKPGTRIKVIKEDGQQVSGKFTGLGRVPEEDYARRLEQAAPVAELPALGDEITIFDVFASEHHGQFVGFDHEYVGFEWDDPARNMTIKIRQGGADRFVDIKLNQVNRILDGRGRTFEGGALRELANSGTLPELSALELKIGKDTTLIALDEVVTIEIKSHKGKTVGFLVGAAVDVAVILIAIAVSSSEPEPAPVDTSASCPSVYSFDGEQYVLDSETYGGALFEAAQRTDWDNLDHLREVRGAYRVKLVNELAETQYVDELKLVVVDHPRGSRVVPSLGGQLHTVSAPHAPIRAIAQNGANVLELVRAKDDQFWVSNPFGRNPDNGAEGRDLIELEFPRPPRTETVKLVFNVQNTWWASYLQGQMLTLHGRELGEWYALLNGSAAARDELKQAMIREGMLLIKLWNGVSWQDAGFVWEVGPSVAKDVVVQVKLRNVPGESLRLKLESTAGLWIVNSVEADYTADLPVQTAELSADEAVDHQGIDLRPVLEENDGRRYVMPTTEDRAEIRFTAPPRSNDLSRSFILKSTGYYMFHLAGDGEPQEELFARLMTEPGAYGQYTIRLLDATLADARRQIERQ